MDTLKKHTLKSIEELNIWSRTGVVLGNSTWSETRTYGSGGANNTNVSVSSTVTEKQRFFIKTANEKEIEINDIGLGVRDGQIVTIVYCGKKNPVNDTGWIMAARNRNTEKTAYQDGSLGTLTGWPTGGKIILAGLGIGAVATFLGLVLKFGGGLMVLLALAAWIGWWVMERKRAKALMDEVTTAIRAEFDRAQGDEAAVKDMMMRNAPVTAAVSEA